MNIELMIYIFVIQFLAFIIKGLVGFGNPLFSSPMLAMKMDNKLITPMNLPIDLSVNAYLVYKNRQAFKWKVALPVALLIMIGVIPGTFFLKLATPWVLKAVLGLFIIGLGIEMITRKAEVSESSTKGNKVLMVLLSIVSGFMAGLFGINMLILAYFERAATNRTEFRSNVCFVFLLENSFRFILYVITGVFTLQSMKYSLVCVPAAALGLFIGGHIDSKLDEATIKKIIIAVFILGGISIFLKAIILKA